MSPMALAPLRGLETRAILPNKPTDPDGLVLSAWAQGFMSGSIVIMACITIANMRKGVLLHKLILIELLLGFWHGTYIFPNAPVYSWYLSATALLLNISWSLHNVISWMKNKPFLGKKASLFYIGTVILVQPYWVLEIYADFAYFARQNNIFVYTRPWEALFRDPWWIFTVCSLFYNIKSRYDFEFFELIRISPRFTILLGSMLFSIVFTLFDILVVTNVLKKALPDGIDPFWQLSTVFKLLTDTMILDDFKSALDRLHAFKMAKFSADGLGGQVTNTSEGPGRHSQPSNSVLGDQIVELGQDSSNAAWTDMKPHSTHKEFWRKSSRDRD